MHQTSLFVESSSETSLDVIEIASDAPKLSRTQKKFNQLVERVSAQRRELDSWRVFGKAYHQQLADDYQPALARLRKRQVAMVNLLHQALEGDALGKRDRNKVREILIHMLSPLLAESQDPELVRIYDKYADQSFDDEQHERFDDMRAAAEKTLGVDVGAYPGSESPEELAEWLEEQIQADGPEPEQPTPRKKSAKSRAREALKEEADQGGKDAVREVFRKLVSELHPDRESDPLESARKTELMQRVNQAYKAGDLLTLLELQLSIEQMDLKSLAGLAEERLQRYVHVLDIQSRRLRDELAQFVAPFAMAMGTPSVRKLSPAIVQRSLEADIREIQVLVRSLDSDLIRFRDIAALKRSLKGF